jgi:hypothetical protein
MRFSMKKCIFLYFVKNIVVLRFREILQSEDLNFFHHIFMKLIHHFWMVFLFQFLFASLTIYKMIRSEIERNSSVIELFSFVRFEFLSIGSIEDFISWSWKHFEAFEQFFTQNLWTAICCHLCLSVDAKSRSLLIVLLQNYVPRNAQPDLNYHILNPLWKVSHPSSRGFPQICVECFPINSVDFCLV